MRLPRVLLVLFDLQSPSATLMGRAHPVPPWVRAVWAVWDALASIASDALAVLRTVAPVAIPVAVVLLLSS